MSQTNPSPTINSNAKLLKAHLESYATPRGGVVEIVENERHLIEYLTKATAEKPIILILNQGEVARGEYAGGDRTALHRVDRKWMVVVMRGHGFKNISEAQGVEGTPAYVEPFSDSCETVRDGCRVLRGMSEEYPNNYENMMPLANLGQSFSANVFLDCRAILFSTAADIPVLDGNGTVA